MAEHMRFVAIILIAVLLGAACSGDSSAEPTISPTATPPPESESPSNIDVTEWRSYVSPIGFELRYPPEWTLDSISDGHVRIVDPIYKKALDDAIAAGQGDVGLPPILGASQFSVIADISAGFDVNQLIGSCGTEAVRTTLAGRTAIRCPGAGTVTDTLHSAGHSYWVEFPPEHTLLVGGSVISEGVPDLAIVEAILSTFNFTQVEAPPIDTSAWPLHENDFHGFSMRYPPTWVVEEEEFRPGYVYFRNAEAQAMQARREARGENDVIIPGEGFAQIQVGTFLGMRFGLETLIGNCPGTAISTTFAGLPATMCSTQYWVERPSGGLIAVLWSTNEAEPRTHQLIAAALATITFHE